MQNCECYDKDGKFLGWFSRSVAVLALIHVYGKDGRHYVLASQRGKGTPDPEYVGKWNLCCGYLDFNETGKESVIREVFEETGVNISNETIRSIGVNTDPTTDKRQNVTLRYVVALSKDKEVYERQFSHKNNEKDEVGEIKFIDYRDIDKYEWAFGHDKIIKNPLNNIV